MKNKKYIKNYSTYLNLSKKELKEIAEQQNKSIEEVANDYKHALKELKYTNKKLRKIIKDFQ